MLNTARSLHSLSNLYEAQNLKNIIVPNNLYGGIDLAGKTGLSYVNVSNCSLGYLNVDDCPLTGLYAQNNNISGSYLNRILSGLAENSLQSGVCNISGNNSISQSSLSHVSSLSGLNWNVFYDYVAPTTTTTTTTTTT